MAVEGTRDEVRCSFCGKSRFEVERVVAGPADVFICDECVALCTEILAKPQGEQQVRAEPPIDLVCLDMAGTTVSDDGLVERAFAASLDAASIHGAERERMLSYIDETMGQSKIDVFRALFDETTAGRANSAFEAAYSEAIASGGARPIEGAGEAIAELRARGKKVAFLTGFSGATRDRLLDSLGWREAADLALCPAEAGRGRPAPDLVLTAVLRLGVSDVAAVAVCGDTASDILTGKAAGATLLAGVLTGSDPADRLWAAGATDVLASVADLPAVVARRD